jgi:hypothetical protein
MSLRGATQKCLCEERSDEAISGHNATDGQIAAPTAAGSQ